MWRHLNYKANNYTLPNNCGNNKKQKDKPDWHYSGSQTPTKSHLGISFKFKFIFYNSSWHTINSSCLTQNLKCIHYNLDLTNHICEPCQVYPCSILNLTFLEFFFVFSYFIFFFPRYPSIIQEATAAPPKKCVFSSR